MVWRWRWRARFILFGGPKGLRRFFAQNLPGGLIVREVNRQWGQSSWVNREVYTYSRVFTHLMNDTMKPLDHQTLSKPILYPIPWQLSPKKLPGDFLSKGHWTIGPLLTTATSGHHWLELPSDHVALEWRWGGWAGRKPRFPHASRRVFTYDYVSRGDESWWKHERQSSWTSSKLALPI